jgi:hypothetical protein
VPALFVVTLFVSGALLFLVQPMVGKMVLPLLGGSPAAWNTCMVFFQGLLLLGYLYAHYLTTRREPPHRQPPIHMAVLGLTVGWLLLASFVSPSGSPVPVFRSLAPQGQSYPMLGVLLLLTVAIGLPFLVVTTHATLFQKWFGFTGHPSSMDPYFLYAASNAGNLLSLIAYPLVIEPSLTLSQQAWLWAGGFVLLAGLAYACGQMVKYPHKPWVKAKVTATDDPPPTLSQKLRWVGLAFVPSSLMLGVTFYMTTDIASLPLLWLIPLGLYLVTFIIAFGRTPYWLRPVLGNLSPVLTLLLVFVMVSGVMGGHSQHFLAIAVHLAVYFFTALTLHTELVRERPRDVRYLTNFYLLMSLGGVLGGVFNGLLAPVLFPGAWEYPIAIAAGCFLIPVLDPPGPGRRRLPGWLLDLLVPLAFLAAVVWWFGFAGRWATVDGYWVADKLKAALQSAGVSLPFKLNGRFVGSWEMVRLLTVYALPCVVCFLFVDRPVRFGLCVAAILGVWTYRQEDRSNTEAAARSYFGILRVEREEKDERVFFFQENGKLGENEPTYVYEQALNFRKLSHGTTLHGMQASKAFTYRLWDDVPVLGAFSPWDVLLTLGAQGRYDYRQEPLTYYHRTGPVGHMVRRFRALHPDGTAPMAMVGLGTGTVACYAQPGQKLTFYEIDPTVVKLVEGDEHFSYIADARKRGATVEFVLGDARVKLEEHTDRKYALLLVDAFSSDAIPVHLLTKQAVDLYKSRLSERGILGLHISNRHIDLEPVCGRLAKECGLVCRVFSDEAEGIPGKTASSWVVLARSEADLGDELTGPDSDTRFGALGGGYAWQRYNHPWREVQGADEVPAWTDDYSDVLRVMKIEEIRKLRRLLGLPVPGEKK